MTHNDIYTRFMIEYDKANIASSYPSLTKYEIQILLDKAYLALISLKFTGNNQRKVAFEYDIKSIQDLQPLIKRTPLILCTDDAINMSNASNELTFICSLDKYKKDVLYPIQVIGYVEKTVNKILKDVLVNIKIVNHDIADKFKATDTNVPWVKNPIAYLEGNYIHIIYDALDDKKEVISPMLVYISKPVVFENSNDDTDFELSDTMAEELINLAIVFATETVESPRVQTKASLMTLEA